MVYWFCTESKIKMERFEYLEELDGRGGFREGSGRKYKWKSGKTKAVRIPVAILEEVLEYAQKLDSGILLKNDISMKTENEINEAKAFALGGLKVGKQSTLYKKSKKVLDTFIELMER